MMVNALPRYRVLGGIFSMILLCSYLFVAVLFRQPIHALFLVLPMLILFASVLVPTFLDQNGVEYRIEDNGIRLIRFGHTRKFIRYDAIRSVRNQRGTVILRMKGFWSGSQLLHPDSHIKEFVRELQMKIAEHVRPDRPLTAP